MGRNVVLPSADEPMIAADGSVLLPTVASTFRRIETPNTTQAQKLISNTRRKLADMPGEVAQLNAFAAVLVYSASGLADAEISIATGIPTEHIATLREQQGYKMLEAFVLKTAREESAGAVRAILAKGEEAAAKRVVELAESVDEKVALAASKDILDRGGHKPKDEVDVNLNVNNTFRIEVVDRRDERVIDIGAQ